MHTGSNWACRSRLHNIGLRANPAYADLSLASSTQDAWVVLPDGVRQIVSNDRRVADNRRRNDSSGETVRSDRSFLTYRAVRCDHLDAEGTTAAAHGLDVHSNNNTTYETIAGVTAPVLILQGTADNTIVHLTLAELIYNEATATPDRTLMYVRGASHGLVAVAPQFGDTFGTIFDAFATWLRARY